MGAVGAASRAVTSRSSVPALEGILIEAAQNTVTFTGYNLATGIRAVVETETVLPGSVVLPAKLFGEIIRKSPDTFIQIETVEFTTVKITCGMSEFTISGISPQDFPELPAQENEQSLTLPANTLKSMISLTIFAVSDNENKPVHTGSLFDLKAGYLNVVSVDGYRMAIRREKVSATVDFLSFVVPGSALREVERICGEQEEDVQIHLGRRHITFEIGPVTLISRLLEGEFINYAAAIPKEMKYRVILDTKVLLESVERVSLIINERIKNPIRCVFEHGNLKLSCNTALGRAYDEIAIEGDGGNIEIGFNNRYLHDALKAVPDEKISLSLSNGLSPCMIRPLENEDYQFMVLPVRLKA